MTVMSSLAPLFQLDATFRLKGIFRDRLWKHAQNGPKFHRDGSLAAQAILALRDPEAGMDSREWAERYLADIIDMPLEEFTANHRAQS
ncbi:MAG TPA: hypothetical protein VM659_22120 [Dongiaceae bacterium]|nr:hypothetical protein [Dongiaceae bacterium]